MAGYSGTPLPGKPNVTIVDTAPADTIRMLKRKSGKDIRATRTYPSGVVMLSYALNGR